MRFFTPQQQKRFFNLLPRQQAHLNRYLLQGLPVRLPPITLALPTSHHPLAQIIPSPTLAHLAMLPTEQDLPASAINHP